MDAVLEMSTVSSKGQVTIPASVRRAIGVRSGDKILSVRRGDGTVSLFNQNMVAMRAAIDSFAGAADEADVASEDDLNSLVREARAELWAERSAAQA